jgi:hypothetical protein
MNRSEKIKSLARQNKRRQALPNVRENLSRILHCEIAEQDFLSETQSEEISDRYFSRLKQAHEENRFILRRHYLPENYVLQNQSSLIAFAEQAGETVLQGFWENLYWWLRVESKVFRYFPELTQLEHKEFYLSDEEIENGFLLVQQKLYLFDGKRENKWTLEVFGEKWHNLAKVIF